MVFLIGFDVAARLLPHVPGVSPVAASALFAGMMLRIRRWPWSCRSLAMLSDVALPGDDWRITLVVYAAITVARGRRHRWRAAGSGASRLLRRAVVLADLLRRDEFRGVGVQRHVPLTLAGLVQCYIAALPFLKYTVPGDLFWAAVLFGGAWLVQRYGPALSRARALTQSFV